MHQNPGLRVTTHDLTLGKGTTDKTVQRPVRSTDHSRNLHALPIVCRILGNRYVISNMGAGYSFCPARSGFTDSQSFTHDRETFRPICLRIPHLSGPVPIRSQRLEPSAKGIAGKAQRSFHPRSTRHTALIVCRKFCRRRFQRVVANPKYLLKHRASKHHASAWCPWETCSLTASSRAW